MTESQPGLRGRTTSPIDDAFTTRPATTPPGAIIALTLEPNEGNLAPAGPIVSSGATGGPPA
jgi:hypothetical protein